MGKHSGYLTNFLAKSRNSLVSKYAAGKKIIDIGCDDGNLRNYLPTGTSYFGIDINDEKSPQNFRYKKIDVEKKIDINETFECATMVAVIEHLKEPEKALRNIYGVLKKEGLIVITTPTKSGNFAHKIFSRFGLVSSFAAEDHQKIFELHELKKLLEKTKYMVMEARTFQMGFNQIVIGKKI